MEWYYQGMSDAMIALRKQQCTGKYVRVAAAAAPVAKLQLDTTHSYLGACDLRQAPEGNGRGTCVDYRSDSNPAWFNVAKKSCPTMTSRCPIEGATGRCDRADVITFYYMPQANLAQNNVGLRAACEASSGSWTQP